MQQIRIRDSRALYLINCTWRLGQYRIPCSVFRATVKLLHVVGTAGSVGEKK